MTSSTRPVLTALALALGLTWPLNAQMPRSGDQVPGVDNSPRDDVPAHLAVIEGVVTLERDAVAKAAELNTVLLAGDRLRTDRGRVEIMFGDGSALDLDQNTNAELVSDSLVRLRAGSLRLAITRLSNDIDYRIDAAGSSAHIASAGDFLVSLVEARRSPELDLAVYRGTAELENAHGRIVVRAGLHAWASEDSAPSSPATFNTSASDDFDAWVGLQRSAEVGPTSPSYLPPEMRSYSGSLDTSGTWQNDPTYGEVWYPQVDAGWQPYTDGYWTSVGGYGWFWVGHTPWSWPTHHYGRWGHAAGRWFWVPGRQWGPGWVTWSTSPGFVGWHPIGPTPAGGHSANGFAPVPPMDMNRGWSTVPSQQFGMPGFPVYPSPPPIPGSPTTSPRPGGGPLMPPTRSSGGQPLRAPTGTRTKVVAGPEAWSSGQTQSMSRAPGAGWASDGQSGDRPLDRPSLPGQGRELHSPSHSSGAVSTFSRGSFASGSSSSFSRAPLGPPAGNGHSQPPRMGGSGDGGRGERPAQLPSGPTGRPSGDRSDEVFHPGHVPSQFSRPAQPSTPPPGAPGKAAPAGRGRGGN